MENDDFYDYKRITNNVIEFAIEECKENSDKAFEIFNKITDDILELQYIKNKYEKLNSESGGRND